MEPWLDRGAARRWFERAATAGDDPLAREVERRMAARLDYIVHHPGRILDLGTGVGAGVPALRRRYPAAQIIAADSALALIRRARGARPFAERVRSLFGAAREHFVCADMSAVPLAAGACAMVWSNLALAWAPDFGAALREWHRVLEVGGLLMFTTYGPDTLKELRAAFAAAEAAPHVHPFADMHDLGDALVATGFADPVMDMETFTLTYATVDTLFAELRSSGRRNALSARRRTLTGRRAWVRMLEAYAARRRDGRLPATFEVVYGHAWKAAPKVTADGRAIIRFDAPPRSRKADGSRAITRAPRLAGRGCGVLP